MRSTSSYFNCGLISRLVCSCTLLMMILVIQLMAEILHQLIDSLSHYLQGLIHRWCTVVLVMMILVWKIKERFLGFYFTPTLTFAHEKIFGQNFHNALSNLDSLYGSGRNWVWLGDPIWSVRVVHIKWVFMKQFIVRYIVDLHFDDRYLLVYLQI